MAGKLEVSVYISLKKPLAFSKSYVESIARHVARDQKLSRGSLSISFVGNQKIKTLNRVYRKKDKVTDILSFPAREGKGFVKPKIADFGDIFLCYPKLLQQAKSHGRSLKYELAVLVVHGVLHLFGYGHETENQYAKMEKIEDRILKKVV